MSTESECRSEIAVLKHRIERIYAFMQSEEQAHRLVGLISYDDNDSSRARYEEARNAFIKSIQSRAWDLGSRLRFIEDTLEKYATYPVIGEGK